MKRVTGIVEHNPPESYGDCFRAALASVLGVDAQHVPHFLEDGITVGWLDRLRAWCFARGLYHITLDPHTTLPPGYHIAFGTTEAGNQHCVVMDGEVQAHDPSPNSTGLAKFEAFMVFYLTDADRFLEWRKSCE